MKIAIAGTGYICTKHEAVWKSFPDCEIVAVFDKEPQRMEQYPYAKPYTDFDEMIEREKPDIVDICLPVLLHADFAIRAIQKGINVVCEKPISLDPSDIRRIYDAAERSSAKFMVAQVVRFWDEYELLKKIYETERFGKLLSGSMRRLGGLPKARWMLDEKLSGGIAFDLHIHDLDFMVYALGKPKKHTDFRRKAEGQDYLSAVYEYEDFVINTEASWYASPYPSKKEFIFQFERAVVAYENNELRIYTNEEFSEEEFAMSGKNAFENELRYFADCVAGGKTCDKIKCEELEYVITELSKM